MRKFKGKISVGLVGCIKDFEFEVDDDDASDEDIEEIGRDAALEEIEWWWEEDSSGIKS